MGIKFKQIDNLQNTFDSLYESLGNRIENNTDDISGVLRDSIVLSGWKYFENNVDVSGLQGLLVENDNIYTPNNLIAGGAKIGFSISTPRNSTPAPLGALQVTGGQIYFEDQLNVRNDSDIVISNGSITANEGFLNSITGDSANYASGIFESGLTVSGVSVATGEYINYSAASGISLSNNTFITNGTGYFEKLAVNIESANEAIEVSGNILLQNNDIIKWKDLDGIARNVLYIDSSDVLNLLNNTTGDGGKIVIRNKPGANTSATFDSNGFLGIGISNPQGILDISSTSSAPIMPRMTSAQMNAIASPVEGMLIYNTDSGKFAGYTGAWSLLH